VPPLANWDLVAPAGIVARFLMLKGLAA